MKRLLAHEEYNGANYEYFLVRGIDPETNLRAYTIEVHITRNNATRIERWSSAWWSTAKDAIRVFSITSPIYAHIKDENMVDPLAIKYRQQQKAELEEKRRKEEAEYLAAELARQEYLARRDKIEAEFSKIRGKNVEVKIQTIGGETITRGWTIPGTGLALTKEYGYTITHIPSGLYAADRFPYDLSYRQIKIILWRLSQVWNWNRSVEEIQNDPLINVMPKIITALKQDPYADITQFLRPESKTA